MREFAAKAFPAGFEAVSADEGQGGVAELCEGVGCISEADVAGVLGEGAVANPKEPVFDLPMIADEREEADGIALVCRQAGDGLDHLAGAQRLGFTPPLYAADAGQVRPLLVEAAEEAVPQRDAAGLEPVKY